MYRTILVIVVVCHAVVVWSGAARAESSPANRDEARRSFQRGLDLVEQERWEEALEAFDASLEIYPTQTALFNRAMCLSLMGRPVDAIRELESHRARYGDTVNAERRAEVLEELQRLQRRVGRVEVQVQGAQAANVYLDGTEAGTAPLQQPLVVNPGRHELEVRAADSPPVSRWVTVGAGDQISVVISIASSADASGSEEGEVTVISDEGEVEPPPIESEPPPLAQATEPSRDRGRGLRIGAYASTGVAVAALGTALGLFLWNRGQFETWETEDSAIRGALAASEPGDQAVIEGQIADNNALHDRIGGVSAATWAMLGLGSAAAAAAVVLFVLAPRMSRGDQVSLLPVPGGLALAAAW